MSLEPNNPLPAEFRARLEAAEADAGSTVVSGEVNDYDLAQLRECATRRIRRVHMNLAGVDPKALPETLLACIDAIRARGIQVHLEA
jgi:hypothetical protein